MNCKSAFLGFLLLASSVVAQDKKFVIVTASYNNKLWAQWNLDSVATQQYDNWRMIYVDDCSTDGTLDIVKKYIIDHKLEYKITVLANQTRRGSALANQFYAIHTCAEDEVIVLLDGDDALAHSKVLTKLNEIYADPNVWITYGQFIEYPSGTKGFCIPMPEAVIKNNAFRKFEHIPSHLKSFYAKLFKSIKTEDLMFGGKFFSSACNMAAMMPMMEMAGEHHRFVSDILYIYNGSNPLNAHKVNQSLQRSSDLEIRSRKPYAPLETLF